jgi:hypothetical protein
MENNNKYNVVTAYIKTKKKCIIYILGLPCTSKTKFGIYLAGDLNLEFINANKYMEGYIEKNNIKIYEHPNNMKWKKLIEEVTNKKNVVISGNYINKYIEPDFVYFLSMNKQLCKQNLLEFNASTSDDSKYIDPNVLDTYIADTLYPLYEEEKSKVKINKFINIKETSTEEEIYSVLFDSLIEDLTKELDSIYKKNDLK